MFAPLSAAADVTPFEASLAQPIRAPTAGESNRCAPARERGSMMRAREFYLHLAEVCERAAATAPLPKQRSGCWLLLLCGAGWWQTSGGAKQRHQQQPRILAVGLAPWTPSECSFVFRRRCECRSVALISRGSVGAVSTAGGWTPNSNDPCPFQTDKQPPGGRSPRGPASYHLTSRYT